jgi:hypothetical protein
LALTLVDDERAIFDEGRSIKRAFECFGLDPNQPHHWRKLLGILAHILFGERAKGPKIRWDFESFKELVSDFDDVSSRCPPGTSQMSRFELLTGREKYFGLKATTLKARYNEGKRRLKRLARR